MEQHPRKRGRPMVVVTDVVLQRRRLAKQRSNAKRARATPSGQVGGTPGSISQANTLPEYEHAAQSYPSICTSFRGKRMTVALWEEKAEQFQAALNETGGVPVFAVICGLLAKFFADNVTLSSTDATKSYLNIDYKPLIELRKAVVAASGKSIAELPPPANRLFVTASSNTLQRLTIQEILAYQLPPGEKQARCLCHAKIVAIMEGEGWYYICCPKCARKVRLLGQGYYCGNCAENVSDPKPRYRLIVRVVDPSGTITFTLFNKEVECLVVILVENILAELNQGNHAAEIPAVLNNVIGKTCGFDVKISSYNTNLGYEEYTVVKLSEYDQPAVEAVAEPNGAGAGAQEST